MVVYEKLLKVVLRLSTLNFFLKLATISWRRLFNSVRGSFLALNKHQKHTHINSVFQWAVSCVSQQTHVLTAMQTVVVCSNALTVNRCILIFVAFFNLRPQVIFGAVRIVWQELSFYCFLLIHNLNNLFTLNNLFLMNETWKQSFNCLNKLWLPLW